MDKIQVLNLAKLARIKLLEKEAENLSHEFESILKYVGEVKEVKKLSKSDKRNSSTSQVDEFPVHNVMREDGKGHESGIYTKEILGQVPAREGDYVVVKKIL